MLVLQGLAVLSVTLFAGAALYVSLVEHPARLACGDELAVREFGPSYARAAPLQASLAVVAAAAGAGCALSGSGPLWWVGAALILGVLPYTFVVMMAVNRQLLAAPPGRGARDVGRLLRRWGRLHAVRTGLGLAAAVIYVAAGLA